MMRDWLHFRSTMGRIGFVRLIAAYCLLLGVYIPSRFDDPGSSVFVFALIPLYLAGPLAVDAIAGERDRKTLEALLCTPIGPRELMLGKLLFPVVTALSFSLLAMICNFGYSIAAGRTNAGPGVFAAAAGLGLSLSVACSAIGLHISLDASSSRSAQQWYSVALLMLSVGLPLGLKSLLPVLDSDTAAAVGRLFEGGPVSMGTAILAAFFLLSGLILAFLAQRRFRNLWRMNGRSQI